MSDPQPAPAVRDEEAARELLRRRRARRGSILDFARYLSPAYTVDPLHAALGAALDRVLRGECLRLIVTAPPQTGKSAIVSVYLPALWLGRNPDVPVMLATYAGALASHHLGESRGVAESERYGLLFPGSRVNPYGRSATRWSILGRMGYARGAGIGGSLTGFGGGLGVVDDPHENQAQADSALEREAAWTFYRSTFRERIRAGGAIVVTSTRWHMGDLPGRLLRDQAGEWELLRLPALAETQEERDAADARLGLGPGRPDPYGGAVAPGESSCSSRFSTAHFLRTRVEVGARAWAAQYVGVPVPAEGSLFQTWKLGLVHAAPAGIARARAWDLAGTQGAGDWTAGVLLGGPDGEGLYYVLDVVRGRWDVAERNAVIRRTAEADGGEVKIVGEQEGGSGGKEAAARFVSLLAGFRVSTVPATGSKRLRAEGVAAQVDAGNVRLVQAPWCAAFVDEVAAFDAGTHDDQVDALSYAFNALAATARAPGDFGFSLASGGGSRW